MCVYMYTHPHARARAHTHTHTQAQAACLTRKSASYNSLGTSTQDLSTPQYVFDLYLTAVSWPATKGQSLYSKRLILSFEIE